jgi:hypothetical protein
VDENWLWELEHVLCGNGLHDITNVFKQSLTFLILFRGSVYVYYFNTFCMRVLYIYIHELKQIWYELDKLTKSFIHIPFTFLREKYLFQIHGGRQSHLNSL